MLSRMNAVRFFVIFAMMFGYASTMSLGPEFPESLAIYGYDPSWHAIQVLFFLSGLLAYRSIEKGHTGLKYLSSRFLRNIPLLGFLTVAILFILFPLFGTADDSGLDFWARIIKYVMLTTFCIDPSMRVQGLMDDAKYMCLVQGGLWTLRIGIIIHLAIVGANFVKLLSNRLVILMGTVFVTVAYALLGYIAAKKGLTDIDNILTVLRLTYAFGIGVCVWAYKDKMLSLGRYGWAMPLVFFAIASLNYFFFTWTTLIEVNSTFMFLSLAWLLLTTQSKALDLLKNWTNTTMVMMVIGWPTIQTLLLIYPELGRWTLPLYALPTMVVLTYITTWSLAETKKFRANRLPLLVKTH